MYRKFSADHLFTGRVILDENHVLITTEDGVVIEILPKSDAGNNIESHHGLLTPGFINAHCHLELSHLKDKVQPATGLVQFVQQVMANRGAPDENKLTAMQLADKEMFDGGIVAVGDICNTADALSIKAKSKLRWHNFIEVSGFTAAAAAQRLEAANKVLADYLLSNNNSSFSPHAPYSVSKTLFEQLNAETANQLVTIHNQECAAEDELYLKKTGGFLDLYNNFGIDITAFTPTEKSSFKSWLPYFTNNQSIVSVHNTFTSQADIDFYTTRNHLKPNLPHNFIQSLYFCICINANKYIEQMLPPINLLRTNKCKIIIGTDSYASNWQLSILEEIKTIQLATNFTIPLAEILRWATINGATALQMDKELGSFEKNKKPGVVLIQGLDGLNTMANSSCKRIL